MEVLRDRGFRLLLGAQGVSMFGDRMVAIALAFAVLELDGSPTEVGLVLAARTLPLVACLLLGGVVADRASRRGVMVASDLVRLASQGLLAGLLISGSAEIWMLAVLSGITGAAGGFFNPAAVGLLPGIVSPEHLQQANGIRATVYSVSEIAGPVLAGLLVAAFGAGWALGIDAGDVRGQRRVPRAPAPAAARRARRHLVPHRPARRLAGVPLPDVGVDLRLLGGGREPGVGSVGRARPGHRRPRPRRGGHVGRDPRRARGGRA